MAAPSVALVWYLVIAGPQGGMVVLPSTFDTREQCTNAVTEYQKQPTPAGWAVNCRKYSLMSGIRHYQARWSDDLPFR